MCYQVSATETCPDLRDLSTLIIINPEEMELGIPGLMFFNVKRKSGERRFWGFFFRIENFLWDCPGVFVWLGFFGGLVRHIQGEIISRESFPALLAKQVSM